MKVGLISCVKSKRKGKYPASELYNSTLFNYAFKWAKKNCDKIFILSAKYGLVEENDIIEDYEKTLNNMNKNERIKWSRDVSKKLKKKVSDTDKIKIITGKKYYEFLIDYIPCPIEIIGEKLPIDKKLKFLKEAVK